MKKPQMKKSFDKNDTLIIKGIAILLMLFYHLFESPELLVSMKVDHRPFPQSIFLLLSGFGNICVALFVFLSAYGITTGLKMPDEKYTVKQIFHMALMRCGKLIANFTVMYLSVNLLWFKYFDYANLYGKGWQGGFLALIDMLGLAQTLDTPTLNMTWWYMRLAIIIIFIVPLIYLLARKIGTYTVLLGILLPLIVEMDADMKRYLIVMIAGTVAAQEGWFEVMFRWKLKKTQKALLGGALILICIPFRQNYMVHTYFLRLVDAPIAFLLCWFGSEIIGAIPGLHQILTFFGKHSMNIFFVHTFFYMILFRRFIYSFHYAALIFLMLAAISLAYSVILELLKNCGRILMKKYTKSYKTGNIITINELMDKKEEI